MSASDSSLLRFHNPDFAKLVELPIHPGFFKIVCRSVIELLLSMTGVSERSMAQQDVPGIAKDRIPESLVNLNEISHRASPEQMQRCSLHCP